VKSFEVPSAEAIKESAKAFTVGVIKKVIKENEDNHIESILAESPDIRSST
jgi:hypothetical protein